MKKILVLITVSVFIFTTVNAQYSSYYNKKLNVNVSGSINQTQTIRTIDYGALELANAQKEQNRLENLKYEDEQQRRISLEIAADPLKAYDYGYENTFTNKGKDAKKYGFKQFTMSYRIPNNTLFIKAGAEDMRM